MMPLESRRTGATFLYQIDDAQPLRCGENLLFSKIAKA
jgi:hypothetical protein